MRVQVPAILLLAALGVATCQTGASAAYTMTVAVEGRTYTMTVAHGQACFANHDRAPTSAQMAAEMTACVPVTADIAEGGGGGWGSSTGGGGYTPDGAGGNASTCAGGCLSNRELATQIGEMFQKGGAYAASAGVVVGCRPCAEVGGFFTALGTLINLTLDMSGGPGGAGGSEPRGLK